MQYGKIDEAISFWNQALAINPTMLLVRTNLAAALLRKGQADEARSILRKALEFNPAFQPASDLIKKITK
jgi:Flp pilus assembly protein TadD